MALLFGYTPKEGMIMTVITGTPVGGGVDGNSQWRPDTTDIEWSAARGGRGDGGVHCTGIHFRC